MSDYKAEREKKAALFASVFGSDDGKKVLAYLKDELVPRDIINTNQIVIGFNLGKRESYLYITDKINFNKESQQ